MIGSVAFFMKPKQIDWIIKCMNAAVRSAQAAPDG
eukprot:SAG31_NODE_19445_length_602_cov_0.506958_1_plen_34_part_01